MNESLTTAACDGVCQNVPRLGNGSIYSQRHQCACVCVRTGADCGSRPAGTHTPLYENIDILLMSSPFQH